MSTLNRKGFTLVELSFSIAFIAILSIIIVLMITNTISSYRRGLTLNKINSTGMDLVDEIRATVQNSPSNSVKSLCHVKYNSASPIEDCEKDGGKEIVSAVVYKTLNISGGGQEVPAYGAFCAGTYSYIWNSGYFFSQDYDMVGAAPAYLKFNNGESVVKMGEGDEKFKMIKLEDAGRRVCLSMLEDDFYSVKTSNEIDISETVIVVDEPVEILSGDTENDLAIYYLDSATPAESKESQGLFYNVSFVLGTVHGGINVKTSGNFCATPGGETSELENLDFCAINKFNFAVQATGASQ